jgi:uncharacterized protein
LTDALKILLVFVLLVVLLLRRYNLGAVMFGSAVLIGLLFQLNPADLGWVAIRTVTTWSNLELILALAFIMLLEDILRREGILRRMVAALRGLVRDPRVVMATLPALVGLLPSAGGARFSAPMVEEVGKDSDASPERKAFINFWYRHIWEMVLPLYPTLLLTVQFFQVPMASMIVLLSPIPVLAIIVGWPTAFRGLTAWGRPATDAATGQHLRDLAAGLAPVATVLLLVLLFQVSIAVAVGLVVLALIVAYRYSPARIANVARESLSWNILASITAIFFFKEMLVESRAVSALAPLMTAAGLPVLAMCIALPFLVGLLTGANQAFIGTTGPILIGLLGPGVVTPPLAAIVLMSGYAGVMTSPAHLCMALTVAYFKADLGKFYRIFLLPQVIFATLTLVYLGLVLHAGG